MNLRKFNEHELLIKSMNAFFDSLTRKKGFSYKSLGFCYGVAAMALQAIFCGDFPLFKRRMDFLLRELETKDPEDVMDMIDKVYLGLIDSAHQQALIQLIQKHAEINFADFLEMDDEKYVISDSLPEILSGISRDLIIEYNDLVQQNYGNLKSKLVNDDAIIIELMPYLDALKLSQDPMDAPFLQANTQRVIMQDIMHIIELTMSIELERKGGIERVISFSGAYDENELSVYFQTLDELIKNEQTTNCLLFRNHDHAILVAYDAPTKIWRAIDINQWKITEKEFKDPSELGKFVIDAYPPYGPIFTTEVFLCHHIYFNLASDQFSQLPPNSLVLLKENDQFKLYMTCGDKQAEQIPLERVPELETELNKVKNLNVDQLTYQQKKSIINVLASYKRSNNFPAYQIIDRWINTQLMLEMHDVKDKSKDQLNHWLFVASCDNHVATARALLSAGADPKFMIKEKSTYSNSIYYGHLEVATLFLEQIKSSKELLLHVAAKNGDVELIKFLLLNGYKIDALSQENETPFYGALSEGRTEAALYLLKQGCDCITASKGRFGMNPPPLFVAIEKKYTEIVEVLLKARNIDPNITYSYDTALTYAINKRNMDAVKLLIQAKADVNQPDNSHMTPLILAINQNNVELVQLLLQAGADPTLKIGSHDPVKEASYFFDGKITEILQNAIKQKSSTGNHNTPVPNPRQF